MIAETVGQLKAMGAKEYKGSEYLSPYKRPSIVFNSTVHGHMVICPNCDYEQTCMIGIEEGPIECDCGNRMYITEEIIYCDESGIKEEITDE